MLADTVLPEVEASGRISRTAIFFSSRISGLAISRFAKVKQLAY
jgi:hypothetical protein